VTPLAENPLPRAIAIIPARGGSKRIPRKNIKRFCGVPLLARTIDLLHSTSLFSRIIVSTDDVEIADVARTAGAEVPFMRDASLADDHTGTIPVIRDAVVTLTGEGETATAICCVYPAAVLATDAAWRECAILAATGDHDYVFPVTAYRYPIQRALRLRADNTCEMLWPENFARRSQDLEPVFHDAGQFYLGTRQAWLEGRPIFGPRSRAFPVPHTTVQDIDTPEDWERAETIFAANRPLAPSN
jgi:N-acylneuraminate cytidylyltransferase